MGLSVITHNCSLILIFVMFVYSINDFASKSTCDSISLVINARHFYLLYSSTPDQYNPTENNLKKIERWTVQLSTNTCMV